MCKFLCLTNNVWDKGAASMTKQNKQARFLFYNFFCAHSHFSLRLFHSLFHSNYQCNNKLTLRHCDVLLLMYSTTTFRRTNKSPKINLHIKDSKICVPFFFLHILYRLNFYCFINCCIV